MALYNRLDARDWARTHLFGMVNHTMPSFTADLSAINEKAIRHDISLAIEHGFTGTLAVSDVAISIPEYVEFLRIAADEADGRIFLVHHASFGTLEQNITALARCGGCRGRTRAPLLPAELLPGIRARRRRVHQGCLRSNVPGRHAARFRLRRFIRPIFRYSAAGQATLTCRLLDECSNIVAIRAEGGYPGIQSAVEHFGREIILSVSIENDFVPLTQVMPMPALRSERP